MPKITVKTERVTKRIPFDPRLVADIDEFCVFYATHAGAKPDFTDAAVGLIEHALENNREFATWRAQKQTKQKGEPA